MTLLGDVVQMTFGFAFKGKDFTDDPGAVRLLRGDNIGQGRLRWDGVKRLPQALAQEFGNYLLEPGDVVLAMDRPWIEAGLKYAVVRELDSPSLLVQRVARLRSNGSLNQRFLGYLVGSARFTDHVRGVQTGSAVPHISGKQIAEFVIDRIPTLEEQAGIAATLGALDDKIDSNRRAMELVEALGASLLEEVLDLDVYGFPEYRSDQQLGDILAVLETGSRPKGGASTDGVGVISLGAESVQSAGIVATTNFKTVPQEFADGMRRGRLEKEDVLVYKDGGKPGNFVPHISAFGYGFPVARAMINEHVYRARAIDGVSQGLLYWLLRSPWMDQEMRKRGTGVAIPGLNSTNFRGLPMPVLTPEIVEHLNGKLSPMLAALLRYGAENKLLATLRDTLLPELLSGRVEVREADAAAAEVVA
jgi:type I restriction enzyme, S subunit